MTTSPTPDMTPVLWKLHLRRAAAIPFALLLAGYMVFNRPFALLGWPPVYVGEIVLALSFVAALVDFRTVFIAPLKHSRTMQLVALFLLYGIVRVAIDAPSRGLDAARDGVICLYAVAAFLGPWLLSRGRVEDSAKHLRLLVVPVSLLATLWALGIRLGKIDASSNVKVDFLTLSTAVAMCAWSFVFLELWSRPCVPGHRLKIAGSGAVFALSIVTLFLLPTRALWPAPFIVGLLVLLVYGFNQKRAVIAIAVFAICVTVAAVAVSRVPAVREKIVALVDPDETHFETRQGQMAAHSVKWRLVFWRRCAHETLERAPVFGLGFGTNLTNLLRETPDWPMYEDSQNAAKYGAPNRQPHSAHVTVFARLGTGGLLIWIALLAAVFVKGLKSCRRRRNRIAIDETNEHETTLLFSEITILSVWSIYILAMSFGVVLENPFGGIWFWTLTGVIANRRTD